MFDRKLAVFLSLIVTAAASEAHDLWLIPEFSARPGQPLKILVHSGDRFPAAAVAIRPEQFARFEVQGAGGKLNVANVRTLDKSTEAEAAIKEAGAYVVLLEIKAQPVRQEAGKFNEYLKREGLDQILDARAKGKKDNQDGKELSTAFAKAIFHVGDKSDPTAMRPLGLKLEIVPQVDPLQLRPGEKLPVLVLFEGKPLADARVAGVSDAFPLDDEEDHTFATRTSYQGIAMIPIMNPGNWIVRLVHMVPAQGGDNDWESFSSSLTFRMAPEKGFPLTVDSIMRGPDLVGHGINPIRWSGDSSKFYFNWRRPGEKEFHKYEIARDGSLPRRLSRDEEKLIAPPGAQSTKDHKRLVYSDAGDIVLQDAVTNQQTFLVRTADQETAPRFTRDEKHVTFVRENNLYRISLDNFELVQLTDIRSGAPRPDPKPTDSQKFLEDQQKDLFEVVRERIKEKEDAEARRKEQEKRKPYYLPQRATVGGLQLSPDETMVVFVQTDRPEQAKSTIVPNFVTESGYTLDINSRTKVGDLQGKPKMGLISVETGEVVWVDHGQKDRDVNLTNASWSEDGKNLVVMGTSADNKDRWIFLADIKTGKTRVLDSLHDDAWVMSGGFGGSSMGWMPDGKSVYFISEKEGYFQVYTVDLDGSPAKALTSGKFEVFGPSLSDDKSRFYFVSSEVHPGERHFYSMPVSGGPRTQITSMTGSNQVVLSPDEKTAAVIYSCSNKPPELYLMDNAPGAKARQITVTPTEEWRSFPWVDPKLITFKARDGAEVYARVYTPEMLSGARGTPAGAAVAAKGRGDKSRAKEAAAAAKRPGVIFVHGAGYAQNAHKYWSSYYHEYMFHHILIDRGYVVMDIDYRASSGYGRDWRTAIYRHMGGKDLDDQVDGARWMADNLNVDPKKIGIYGGSYGGFITLMAMFTTPDVFAAGAALRPVTDWAHYNHGYTANILNVPQGDLEAYRQSSPLYFAEGLKGALLICHGMVDTNVHFQDTVRLMERLIELRKENWEMAAFPVEDHGFQRPDSWADEYKRILRLFETQLKK